MPVLSVEEKPIRDISDIYLLLLIFMFALIFSTLYCKIKKD
jgi:hypothetical protein